MNKRWMTVTSVACVLGMELVSYAQQPIILPGRQPVKLSPVIEIVGAVQGAPKSNIKLTTRSQEVAETNQDHLLQGNNYSQSPGTGFPQRRSVLAEVPRLTNKASQRFSELLQRTSGDTIQDPKQVSQVEHQDSFVQESVSPGGIQDSGTSLPEHAKGEHSFAPAQQQQPVLSSGIPLERIAPPYVPANSDCDVVPWMAPYDIRAGLAPQYENLNLPSEAISHVPTNFEPWWIADLQKRIRDSEHLLPVNVDTLTLGALENAPQIQALRTDPEIRYTYLYEAQAEFDWTAFIETKWQDINEPVGSTLTTNSDRFKNDLWHGKAGLRQKNEMGGEFEFFQQFGYEDQNSPFFVPSRQGTGRLQLNYTQPLLNGSGTAYNRSRMVLAQVEANKSFDEVAQDLQDHLLKVSEAYWELYRARCTFLQRFKVLIAGEEILGTIGGRQEVDAQQRQVLRAKAAVAGRRTDIVRAAAAIRNAESRLRLLVNDPRLLEVGRVELIPTESPQIDYVAISMTGSLQRALMFRPEISQAIRDLRANGVRLGMAENELLPRLDLVLDAYTKGLAGDGDIASGYGKQWSDGRPSYSVGLEFEIPLGNRAANARYQRRQEELNKAVYEFRTVVETGLTDVELAVRDVETSYREMISQYQALVAAETEAYYLEDRWRFLPGGDRSTTLLLEDLLDAQERLANAEGDFVNSQVSYSMALMTVRREMGTLLQTQNQLVSAHAGSPTSPTLPSRVSPEDSLRAVPSTGQSDSQTQPLELIPPSPSF